jgi:hypothetical protein
MPGPYSLHFDLIPGPAPDFLSAPFGMPVPFAGTDATFNVADPWHLEIEFFNPGMAPTPAFSAVVTVPGLPAGMGYVVPVPSIGPGLASSVFEFVFVDPLAEVGPFAGTVTNSVGLLDVDFAIVELAAGLSAHPLTSAVAIPPGPAFTIGVIPEPRAWQMLGMVAIGIAAVGIWRGRRWHRAFT